MTVYPPPLEYRRPATIDEALAALTEDDTRVLAGGHSLLPALKLRETRGGTLVDINAIGALRGIERDEATGATVLGAATTYADALADGSLDAHAPVLADALAVVGDRQIRNRGTVGGNLVQADPGADLPPAMLAIDAEAVLRRRDGARTVPVAALYDDAGPSDPGDRTPASTIAPDELLTAIRVPDADGAGGAYVRKTHQASGYALVGVAARVRVDGTTVADARVAATGLRRSPVRLRSVEDALLDASPGAGALAAERAGEGLAPAQVREDPNVSAAYRRHVIAAYTERAVDAAIARATGGSGDE